MEIIDRFLDLVENTEPTCIVGVNTSVAYEDEEGKPEAFACDVALQWYADGLQCEISTGFCSINIPEEGKGYDRLQTPFTNSVGEYIEDATNHYDKVAECMSQCESLGIAPDDDTTQVYYFDWEEGVCDETVQMLMLYSTPYKGQKLVDSVDEIIPVILKPLMDEAIAEQNASDINQLAEAMVYVIGMSIKQEQPNG